MEEEEQYQTEERGEERLTESRSDGVTESHTGGLEPTLTEINDCGNDNYTLLSLLGHS